MRINKAFAMLVLMNSMVWTVKAQSTFGSIVGVVDDQGVLPIPDAAVKVRSLEDNSVRTSTTTNDGSFQLLNLKPGRYEVIAQKQSVSNFKIDQVQLDARQTARLSIVLSVASVGQTVEVSDAAPIVNTESGTLGDTKKFNQVVQLPMNYRGGNDSPSWRW